MIEELCNDVLLNIFRHYLDVSPQFWFKLGHVCRSWRHIIFTSPLGLHLRLHCTHGKPVLKTLDYWPLLPLVVNYGGSPMLRPPAPEDEENIMAALEKAARVYSISLTISNSLLKHFPTIPGPFSELEELTLQSQDNAQLTLPSAFWWGHRLRMLHSTRIAFPSLSRLLSPSQDLVDLQLHEIPGVGYFSPETFADALCGMTQLQTLSLHFLSLPPRRTYLSLPPPPGDRVVLPALTCFKYRGISKYLDSLVARIDTPRLIVIGITLFNQPTLDASHLGSFINRIEIQRSPHRVDILSSRDTICITFTHPRTVAKLELKISCKQLDWQLSSMRQICDHLSPFLFCVEDLGIDTTGSSSVLDDMDAGQWVRLILAFRSAKNFRVAGECATDILSALHPADEGHKTVLPALRNLHVQERMSMLNFGSFRDSVELCVTQRRLSGHSVQLYYSESLYTCQICCVGFRLWQEFVRHLRDKHPHRYMCPYCGIFQWSKEHSYLFQEHLEGEHPEVVPAEALILNPDLESFHPYSRDAVPVPTYTYTPIQQPQALPHAHTGDRLLGPPPPPPQFPLQPSEYASAVPRTIPYQPVRGYVNNDSQHPAFPQAHVQAPSLAHPPTQAHVPSHAHAPGHARAPSHAYAPGHTHTPSRTHAPSHSHAPSHAHAPSHTRAPDFPLPQPYVDNGTEYPHLLPPVRSPGGWSFGGASDLLTAHTTDYALYIKPPDYTQRRVSPPPQFPVPPTYHIVERGEHSLRQRWQNKALVTKSFY